MENGSMKSAIVRLPILTINCCFLAFY